MSLPGGLLNGDQIIINFGPGYMYYDSNYTVHNEWAFVFSEVDAMYFNVVKINWAGPSGSCSAGSHSCGELSPANPGDQIYYGDFVEFFTYQNSGPNKYNGYLATSCEYDKNSNDHHTLVLSQFGSDKGNRGNYTVMNINGCPIATNNASNGNFILCQSNDTRSCGVWNLVSSTGVGYMSDSHKPNYGPADEANNPNPNVAKTPVLYGDIIYVQCVFDQNCDVGNPFNIDSSSNVYLYCNTKDQSSNITNTKYYYGYGNCDSMNTGSKYPDKNQHYGYALNFIRSCGYSDVCAGSCTPMTIPVGTQVKSGDEICIYSTYTGLAATVMDQYSVGFTDYNDYVPGQWEITYVIKKLDPTTNSFYSNDDLNAGIYLGDPIAMFGKISTGDPGLVYTGNQGNRLIIKTDSTQYDSSNGCGNDGFFFSTWVFVDVYNNNECIGNCSNGQLPDVSNPSPVLFGRSYFLQNFGKTACFSLSIAFTGITNIMNNVFWQSAGDELTDLNTPNLNISTVYGNCPATNDISWRFYLTTATGGYSCTNLQECPINDCKNCPGSDCSQGDGCCGCTTGWSFGKGITDIWDFSLNVLEWIGIAILVIIIIAIAIFIIGSLISNMSKNKDKDKNKK